MLEKQFFDPGEEHFIDFSEKDAFLERMLDGEK